MLLRLYPYVDFWSLFDVVFDIYTMAILEMYVIYPLRSF